MNNVVMYDYIVRFMNGTIYQVSVPNLTDNDQLQTMFENDALSEGTTLDWWKECNNG